MLALLVFYLNKGEQSTYNEPISAYTLTDAQSLPSLALAGLIVIASVAVITGFIALYSTFRVAGPLFRFARNIEKAAQSGPKNLTPIRRDDALQEEWLYFEQGAAALNRRYQELDEAIERSLKTESPEELQTHVARIQRLVDNVRA